MEVFIVSGFRPAEPAGRYLKQKKTILSEQYPRREISSAKVDNKSVSNLVI